MLIEKVTPANDERPMFRITSTAGFFGPDDTLYTVDDNGNPAEIYFDGEPAIEMEPLNEAARVKYVAMLEKLDKLGRETAEKLGRPWTGYRRDLSGALEIATAVQKQEMAQLGAKKNIESIEKVDKEAIPALGARKRGRPKKVA